MSKDPEKEFGNYCAKLVSDGLTSLALGLGYELGLFDLLARIAPPEAPKTSNEIAEAGNFKERYVREWLGAMACANIIEVNSEGVKYWLPKERVKALVGETANTMVAFATMMPALAGSFERVKDCFQKNGPLGTTYSMYEGFHEKMAVITKTKDWEMVLLKQFIPLVPGWKEKLDAGIHVLNVGCGAGIQDCMFGKNFPSSHFVGIDICEEPIEDAKKTLTKMDLKNVTFDVQDATNLPSDWSEKFDYVLMFDTFHDIPYTDALLKETRRVLKPSGSLLVFDIKGTGNHFEDKAIPGISFIYTASLLHCLPISLNYEGSSGLGAMWGERMARKLFGEAGFKSVNVVDVPFSQNNALYVCES